MKKLLLILPAVALAYGCSEPSHSSGTGSSTVSSMDASGSGGSSTLAAADTQFAREAAEGGLAEVQMGQLAAINGQSAQVKLFGQQLVQDHTKANNELLQWAQKKGFALPTEVSEKHKGPLEHLRGLRGEEFDRMFKEHAIDDHQKDIAKYEKAIKDVQDADLKSYAQRTLPVLQRHLETARSLPDEAVTGQPRLPNWGKP